MWYFKSKSEDNAKVDLQVCFVGMRTATFSKKTIYDIGTKILFGSSVRHKPIKDWEIENVRVGFLKLSLRTIWLQCQNVI